MKLHKKIVVFCLVFSLLLTALPMNFISAGAAEADEAKLQLMLDLGIYSLTDDMEYYNENLTREEMASILSVFYGLTEESYPQATGLEDVAEGWSAGHINTMLAYKIMSTYSDGLFRPLTYVTNEAAIKMLIVMMGYQPLAEAKGGYPNGYYSVANELRLLDGLYGMEGKADITRGDFTKLLYNALHIPVLTLSGLSFVEEYKKDKKVTLLTEHLDIYQAKGTVTALPYMELGYGKGAGNGMVSIDNINYYYEADIYDYFGENVVIYYHQTENDECGTILSISAGKNNDTITVDAKDVISFENGRFTYEEDNKTKHINLPSDFLLLFNGRPLAYYQPKHLMPEQGSVRFCDSNGDRTYETVVVTYEVDYHIESVTELKDGLSIKEVGGKDNNRQVFEINNKDFCTVTDRNIPYDLSKIQKDDIVSIAADSMDITTGEVQPDSTVFRIRRASNRIQGVLTNLNETSIGIDGTEYEVTGDFSRKIGKLKVGSKYTFHLNYLGKVADFSEGSSMQKYALLLAASSQGVFEKEIQLKMYTQEGSIVIYDCAENMTIDGYSPKQYQDAEEYLKDSSVGFGTTTGMTLPAGGVWQLVKYTINTEDIITSIDTLEDNLIGSDDNLTHTYTTPNANNIWSDGTLYNMTSRVSNTIATDVTIFVINTALDSDSCYGLMPYSHMGDISEVQLYFDADELGVSKVMFRLSTPSSMNRDSYNNFMVYEKMTSVADADGNPYEALNGILLMEGISVKLPIESKELITDQDIRPGDILQIIESDGVVTEIRKGLSRFGGGAITDGPNWAGSFDQLSDLRYGKVLNYNDAYIRFRYETAGSPMEETLRSRYIGTKVYIFDTAKNKLIQSSISEIRSAKEYGIDAADTFAGLYVGDAVRAMVLYR